ncbi:tetratricopeptide repeat protein [Undibacterium sp.]|uniref:tetratricopeptide repeat protein n=1 Tax=Undibacterium sp. TaxID=1914977 RepID=UPI002731F633|nr:tetratricopeptide repeat protein [Undibacterium sp.]MDP1980135.1 tetratricopeptide repeat protein [Undibacterium sp.]
MHKKKTQAQPVLTKSGNSVNSGIQAAQLLQKALALHQGGQLPEAEAIYLQILAINARHFEALQFLGMIKRSQGELQQSLDLLTQAASINPAHTIIHASIGNVLLDLERHTEAISSYDRFLLSMPDFAETLNNKANALSALGREAEALACYARALDKQPDFPDAYFNRGNLHMDMGQYGLALLDYEQVLKTNPGHFQAWNNRGNALLKLERLQEAFQSYQQGLSIAPDNAELHACLANIYKITGHLNESVEHYSKVLALTTTGFPRQNAALQLAILHYVFGNPANVEALLHVAKEMLGNVQIKDKGSLIYCVFMLKIQLWWQSFRQQSAIPQAQGMLYVIGESHMLSAHNLVLAYHDQHLQCKGLWIEGCTQWRIGHASTNHYQQALINYLQAIPPVSSVLITIGEIDCRIDGGIYKASKKSTEISLEQRVHNTVAAYLNFVASQAQARKLKMIVSGVPAHHLDESVHTQAELQHFGQFLSLFNTQLKRQALEMGMDFLDVFTMTDGGNGKSNQQWHIDAHHLRPDGIMQAFAHHLIPS